MGSASTRSYNVDTSEANLEPKEPILLNMQKKKDLKKLEKQFMWLKHNEDNDWAFCKACKESKMII